MNNQNKTLEDKLNNIKENMPKFHEFMTNLNKFSYDDSYWFTKPVDFEVINLENKIGIYLRKTLWQGLDDHTWSIELGIYQHNKEKITIYKGDVFSNKAETKGSYRGIYGSMLKGEKGNFGEFEPHKFYDRIESYELKDNTLTIKVHAKANKVLNTEERIDTYVVNLIEKNDKNN